MSAVGEKGTNASTSATSSTHLPAPSVRRSPARHDNLWRLALIGVLLLGWLVVARASDLVPPLGATLGTLVDGFTAGWIYEHLYATSQAVLTGFLVAAVFGFPLGYLLGRSRLLGEIFDPLVAGAFAIPRIVFFPILLQLFGVGVGAQAAMAALAAFFPILATTTAGVREVNPLLAKLGRSLSLNPLQMVTKIFIPAAAPSLRVGLRIGFSISFINVIIAEFFAAKDGLGLLTLRAYGRLDLEQMYAMVVLIVLIALLGNIALWFLEKRLRHSAA